MIQRKLSIAVLLAALAFTVQSASAAEILVGSEGGAIGLRSEQHGTVTPIDTSVGSFRWQGTWTSMSLGWALNWDLIVDPDPSISGVAAFTNISGSSMNFTYTVSAFSSVAIASPTVNGASTITVLDTNLPGNGATMAALTGDSIYNAFINAASQQTLFDDPFALVAPAQGIDFDGKVWGPKPATGPLAIGDLFGINHDFSLSAGDQATINSSFFIVPEPATLSLLILGGLVALRRRNG